MSNKYELEPVASQILSYVGTEIMHLVWLIKH